MLGMSNAPHTTTLDRPIRQLDVLRLAVAAECDPRTAAKALREGPHAVRVVLVRERLERAIHELGLDAQSEERR